MRYMNVTADDAVAVLHASPETTAPAPTVQAGTEASASNAQTVTLTTEQLREFAAMAVSASREPTSQAAGAEDRLRIGAPPVAGNVVQLAMLRGAKKGPRHAMPRGSVGS